MGRMKGDIAKLVIAALLGMCVSGVGTWAAFGREVPTRTEVRAMIAAEAPYVQDRTWVRELIESNTAAVKEVTQAVTDLRVMMAERRGG